MRNLLATALTVLVGHASVIAQQNLTLVIDLDAHTLDWLGGGNITRSPGLFADNTFGTLMVAPHVTIDSPLLNYSDVNVHNGVWFQMTQDRSAIDSIRLITTTPPGEGSIFSGTPEGPATPTFSNGDWSRFASLDRGEYTLNSTFGTWSGGINVVVVPEPATWSMLGLGLGVVAFRSARRLRRGGEE